MAMQFTKIWSSKNSIEGRYLKPFEEVSYNLVAFRHLGTINADLICHPYADGPAYGQAGVYFSSRTQSGELHASIMFRLNHKSYHGERSIWVDRNTSITM